MGAAYKALMFVVSMVFMLGLPNGLMGFVVKAAICYLPVYMSDVLRNVGCF